MLSQCSICCCSSGNPLNCGHRVCITCAGSSSPGSTLCILCNKSQLNLKLDPEKWIAEELKLHRFLVLVFYRGAWCSYCEDSLKGMNHILEDVRGLGGDVFAISAQQKSWADHVKAHWNLRYEVKSDIKNTLGKRFNMRTTEKHAKLYSRMIQLAKFFNLNTQQLEDSDAYKYGIVQAGFIVIKQDGTVIYNWRGEPTERNLFGATDRISAKAILDILTYYFNCESEVESIMLYAKNNLNQFYRKVVQDPKLRELFLNFLQTEYKADYLHFIDSVNRVEEKIQRKITKPLLHFDSERVRYDLIDIYNTFIVDKAPQQISFPESVYEWLEQIFIPCEYEDRGYIMNCKFNVPAFACAYRDAVKVLRNECFIRFIMTKDIVTIAPDIISALGDS